jgi:hypothetical protein
MFLVFLAISQSLFAQDEDLLSLLGEEKTVNYAAYAFKSPRVINSHSLEMLHPGSLDFRILHRFGRLDQGLYDMFGLDNASIRLSFDYGITPYLTIGIGRTNQKKEMDGFIKYRILRQSTGAKVMPVTVIWVSGITRNGLKNPYPGEETSGSDRLAYYHQAIVGRKFSDKFTLQLAPTIVHRNLTSGSLDPNTIYALEMGLRYKLSQRVAVLLDYVHSFNRFPGLVVRNPLSVGVDIETGGHVFQLYFSNSSGMNERAFITEANGSWLKGEIQFGFNLSRVFQIVQPKI